MTGDETDMRLIATLAALAALIAASVACVTERDDSDSGGEAMGAASAMMMSAGAAGGGGQAGIWVSGEGKASVEPDIAILSLSVEARGDAVADANAVAVEAMDAVMASLRQNGVAERDIQTRNFNIWPEYSSEMVTTAAGQTFERRAVSGYRVSNELTVKARELGKVGEIINGAIVAGGDSIRFQDLRFTVEDTTALMPDLREKAIMDAREKAAHTATVAGVNLGKMFYIAESGAGGPVAESFADTRVYAMAAASAPAISQGEIEISLTVRAAFGIE